MCKKAASCAFSNFSILDLSRREVWYWNSIVLSCALGKSFKLSILQCKIENSMKKKLIFEMLLYNLYFWQFIWEFLFIFFFHSVKPFPSFSLSYEMHMFSLFLKVSVFNFFESLLLKCKLSRIALIKAYMHCASHLSFDASVSRFK